MDREAWRAAIHGVTKSRTWLSDWTNWTDGFSGSHVQMWELDHKEGWAPKNWCFWTMVLEKTLESPLDCKEINPKYSLEGLMLKLRLQYFGHLIQRTDTFEKTWYWERLMVGEGDDRRWVGWMASPTWWTWVWASSGRWWRTGKPDLLQSMVSQWAGHNWATEKQQQISLFSARARWKVEHGVILKWPMTGNQKLVALAASLSQRRG